ncbi:hypothetical protein ABL78_1249 [Leptomonas seymouri]|uniref:Uncharacterized protein n=1 Tax=Leptomonas seymouri TaxID=5684 RepID=A0A0N1IM79_LEPSE|nr:hypothetical protein ABL78_1249 [Leptomonas seymouri]|eukprot:KPI89668.1 hypothetical protein ABL78_1249 [Leptomonas seymouri]
MPRLELDLPDRTIARPVNFRPMNPILGNSPDTKVVGGVQYSVVDDIIREKLQQFLEFAVPVVAKAKIGSLSYHLGNSRLPVDTNFTKSSGWAVALIVVLCMVCVAVAVLVALCIWWERVLEDRGKRVGGAESDEGGDSRLSSHSRGGRSDGFNEDYDSLSYTTSSSYDDESSDEG